MQKNEMFLTEKEIDYKNLSHYQRTQLELHGNILREVSRPLAYSNEQGARVGTQEEVHIFNLENPE